MKMLYLDANEFATLVGTDCTLIRGVINKDVNQSGLLKFAHKPAPAARWLTRVHIHR